MVKHHTPAPRKTPVTWILVADGRSAKIYVRKPVTKTIPIAGNAKHSQSMEVHMRELVAVRGMEWEAASADEYEVGRDRLGRVFESANPARHMSEPHVDVYEEIKRKLMRDVAGRLNDAKVKRKFHRLALIAPAKMLGEIRKHLDEPTLKSVVSEVPKDLTHFNASTLAAHLEGTI